MQTRVAVMSAIVENTDSVEKLNELLHQYGGYIVGREDLIRRISFRLTAPGIGREEGSYAASYRPYYQGLFMAPHTAVQAVKTSILAAAVFEELGMRSSPTPDARRTDIIQALVIVFSVAGMALTKLPEFESWKSRLFSGKRKAGDK